MSPSRTEPPVSWPTNVSTSPPPFEGLPRNINAINALHFDENLQPKHYDMLGTHPESKILFTDVNILDSTGRQPYRGDVLIEGKNIHPNARKEL